MWFKFINIYSEYMGTPVETKFLTGLIRKNSAHISEMYERLMKYYDNQQCKQLNLVCDVNIDEFTLELNFDGFPKLHMPFDLNAYKALQGVEISRFWVKAISDSIEYVGTLWGWNLAFFERVSEEIAELNYVNEYRYWKCVRSPYDSRKAALLVKQCLENTKIYLTIYRGRSEIDRILLKETEPPVFCYSKYLGNIEWTSESNIRIVSGLGGKVIFECSV